MMTQPEKSDRLLKELLELPTEEAAKLLKMIERRQRTISRMEAWKKQAEELNEDLRSIKSNCDHIARSEKTIWYEDEYGKTLSGGYHEYICPDCGWRNSVEFEGDG
jgi:hypothetical protein